MFVPGPYRAPDASWMIELIHANPLVLMTSNGPSDGVPFATHLPSIPESLAAGAADLSGSVLLGHLNRANPHWAALKDGDAVLLTFTGPHGYVTPTTYDYIPAAPTWNFTSVHVRGTVEKIDSLEGTLDVVTATVRAFEARFGSQWDMTASLEYFRSIAPGVGAFRVQVTGAEGMFKLSQEQSGPVRDRVERSFRDHSDARCQAVGDLMHRLA